MRVNPSLTVAEALAMDRQARPRSVPKTKLAGLDGNGANRCESSGGNECACIGCF